MMPETELSPEVDSESLPELRQHAENLERRLAELQRDTEARVIKAELKVEAVRAGMIDLDGLRMMDLSSVKFNDKGELDGAAHLIAQMKRAKPWLFGGSSTSSAASAPAAQPSRQKRATEMTDQEYREARAALLRQHRRTDRPVISISGAAACRTEPR